jgi:hypothetical protein
MSATSMVTAEVPELHFCQFDHGQPLQNADMPSRPRCDNASLEDARSVARRLCVLRFIETFDDTISLGKGPGLNNALMEASIKELEKLETQFQRYDDILTALTNAKRIVARHLRVNLTDPATALKS